MKYITLCESDYHFMKIIWENEPISSGDLVKKSLEKLGWKKSTTYTMIKKLFQKGYLKNEGGIVKSIISKEQVQINESNYFLKEKFDGSLPNFIATFINNQKLSESEIDDIRKLIDNIKE